MAQYPIFGIRITDVPVHMDKFPIAGAERILAGVFHDGDDLVKRLAVVAFRNHFVSHACTSNCAVTVYIFQILATCCAFTRPPLAAFPISVSGRRPSSAPSFSRLSPTA